MDKFVEFIDNHYGIHDIKKAELLAKELLNINPLCTESPNAFFSTMLKFTRVAAEKMGDDSIEKMLNIFYKANFSYLQDPKVKKIRLLIQSYGELKIYHAKSLDDMGNFLNLIENNSENIFLKWLPQNDGDMKPQDMLNIWHDMEILFKLHAAVCALREIAYMRSKPNDEYDITMLNRIIRIVIYSNGQMLKLDNLLVHPEIQNVIAAVKGSEHINKRWEPLNNLKKESIEFADNLWSKGDKKLHNEMAIYTYKNIKKNHGQLIKDIIGKDAISEACEDAFSKACKDLISNKKLKREDAIFNACKDIISKECKNISSSSDEKLKREDLISEACKNISDDEKLIIKEIYADKFLIKAIRKAIIPIAEKYDRVRGIKGPQNK